MLSLVLHGATEGNTEATRDELYKALLPLRDIDDGLWLSCVLDILNENERAQLLQAIHATAAAGAGKGRGHA
jgi:hypothetical protein